MVGPPTFFRGLMDAPGYDPDGSRRLRLISSGGAGVSAAFVEEAEARLGARVKRTYGSTEAPTVLTDGLPIAAAELQVAADGELLVRGPEVCVGLSRSRRQRGRVHRRRLVPHRRPRDARRRDRIEIVGRTKDVIIRGGENISTAEVEAVLEAHPAIRQAVAVGYPDPLMGERVAAFVVTDDAFDVDAARAWFAERGVAKYKTPERIVVVASVPLLATGKPDRAALRRSVVPG